MDATAMTPPASLRIAAAAYPVEVLPDLPALAAKLDHWMREAAGAGAALAVFPEYAAMEAALVGGAVHEDWVEAAAATADVYRDEIASLAVRYGITILGGSGPARDGERLVNRAWLCTPDGGRLAVDKLMLTPWERRHTALCPGSLPVVAASPWGRLGTLICYDSEFPRLARAAAADILLIPACTDTPAGQSRLRVAAQARALEGQCVTAHATLLGQVPHCPLIDTNTGQAGIYLPPDRDLPADGMLAQGGMDVPGWVLGDAPLALLAERRRNGDVTLRADWSDAALPEIRATAPHFAGAGVTAL